MLKQDIFFVLFFKKHFLKQVPVFPTKKVIAKVFCCACLREHLFGGCRAVSFWFNDYFRRKRSSLTDDWILPDVKH